MIGLIPMYISLILQDTDSLTLLREIEPVCFAYMLGEIGFYIIGFVTICIGLSLIKISNENTFSSIDVFRLFFGFAWCMLGMGSCWSQEMERKSRIYPDTIG